MTWFGNKEEFEIEIQAAQHLYFTRDLQLHGEVLLKHCSCYLDIRGVTKLPLTEILTRDLDGEMVLTGTTNSRTFSLYSKIRMVRMKEVLASPSCFFFGAVAPLDLEELDCFTPCDTILLIQDSDWVLGV
jgi:hypothetical protein